MLSMPARRLIVRLRVQALARGEDPAGAFLLGHHLTWLGVLLWPGSTLIKAPEGVRQSTGLFIDIGGDGALAVLYAAMFGFAAIGVLRLSVRTGVQRTCLLIFLSLSVGLALVYFVGKPDSLVAWDALLRASLAWWTYTRLDEDE